MWYPVSGVTGVPSVFTVGGAQVSVAVPVDAFTVTVALWLIVPPAPVQLSVYTAVAFRAPVDFDPLTAWAPLHAPDAVQAVALVEVQVRVDALPLLTLEGLVFNDTVGAGGAETLTVVDCAAEPPVPVQVRVNFVVAVRAGVACEPAVACAPLQPPEAVQAVALVDDQVSAEVAPLLTVAGVAVKVTAGAGVVTDTVADCAALPPLPLQVSM
jgi:hypothetical protein